jgi:hypothetical protein
MRAKLLKGIFPAAAVLAMAMTTPAQAAFVNTWAYTFSSDFSNSTDDGGFGTFTETPTELSWGPAEGPRSSIGVVDTPTSGFVDTNGDFEAADDYFHNNNALPLGSISLTSTRLTVNIALTPTDPAGAPLAPPLSRSFDIDFFETPNDGSNGVCADGGAVGEGINSAGCADIFTLEFDFGQFDFTYDGVDYAAFLFEDPTSEGFPQLDFLSDAACASVGLDSGCFGFLTAEDARTVAEFVLSVEGQEVPEPAAIGLFGLGLLGLGVARRRRKA